MYARIDENNNSLELFLFYRNTLVFLFIKRKVSEEMPFSSEIWGRNGNNFRSYAYFFRSYAYFFRSYCYKWERNSDAKMAKNSHF